MTRLVEKELEDRKVYIVAGLLSYSFASACDDYDGEPKDYLAGKWEEIIKGLNDVNWVNGKHEGDCTKVPASCLRCHIEALVDEAKELLVSCGLQ
jgi:hypothetical protein